VDDPKIASAHADRAVALASEKVMAPALLARGWVAIQLADRTTSEEAAAEAARIARTDQDRAALAEALELRAAAESTVARARAALREAQTIWTETGAVADVARCELALGRLPDARTDDRLGALLAAETLVAAGVCTGESVTGGSVRIRVLGRFEVLVDGVVVPAQQWQSKKARDLLRILVSRRGRPVPRSELCELLWPDDDPGKTGHRLSVLLSIVRNALDPYRCFIADHFIVADQASIAMDVTRVEVDVERFLADVAHARRLRERGAVDQLRVLLAAAVQTYRGDAFEGEPYDDWSGPLRDEARAAQASALRLLAQAGQQVGDHDASIGYLLRLLAVDPYDEAAHRALVQTLVGAGRHGEAARAFTTYSNAMREIGVRPPDPSILSGRAAKIR
jgi:DNA-binding SARP family transcriptional activator